VKHHFSITNFILIIFSFSSLNAQNWQRGSRGNIPGICEISGVITELNSGKPIEYASISVLKSDGNIETGGVTDTNGRFHIKEIKPGTYDLKIEFMF